MRREAKGEADAVLMKYEAEAAGIRKVLAIEASGYANIRAVRENRLEGVWSLLTIAPPPGLGVVKLKGAGHQPAAIQLPAIMGRALDHAVQPDDDRPGGVQSAMERSFDPASRPGSRLSAQRYPIMPEG